MDFLIKTAQNIYINMGPLFFGTILLDLRKYCLVVTKM